MRDEEIDELEKSEDTDSDKKEEKKSKIPEPWHTILDYVRVIAIGAGIAFLLCKFVIINAQVPTRSMVPTIGAGDRLIGLRIPYYISDPERGDIVIFKTPDPEHKGELYIKRVIGLPGETVVIRAGQVIIETGDGEVIYLDEPYISEPANAEEAKNNQVINLGEDEYFMMGDNRNNSSDSRTWGPVTRDRILARAWLKYYKGFEIID